MFQSLLVANRGEIAVRILSTARRMGLRTIAVHSEVDRDAPHVRLADEAVLIGPAPAAQSYLSVEAILEACRASGAEAVHPGYGFLSERPAFAAAVEAAGLVFVGPNAAAIAAMGDKIESKRRAAAAGVSTVPGHPEAVEDEAEALHLAEEIGYPVMVKASAGGGGKGMRVAQNPAELKEGLALARSEAASAFGDARVFLEKFITEPRHIEIQVLGDKHGTVIHLGERECSIQRRNQKVVEEAPSRLLDAETRARMGSQAVALARAVGYDSAGTVEFVAGQDRSFYFLEMNTRLQVEHPVTEFVTGLDLVEQMIRVAAGEALSLRQADVTIQGWAVETRLYAEDPTRGFLPSVGRLRVCRLPGAGPVGEATVRVDAGVEEGSEVSIHYDPLLAKLVTHAPTREGAIDAMADALDATAVDGIRHNGAFLSAIMASPRWRAGALSTAFIAEEFGTSHEPPEPDEATARRFAAVALVEDRRRSERFAGLSGRMAGAKPLPDDGRRTVLMGARSIEAVCRPVPSGLEVAFGDGPALVVEPTSRPGEPVWRGTIAGEPLALQVTRGTAAWRLAGRGMAAEVRVFTPGAAALFARMPARRPASRSAALLCPMPGVVRSLAVEAGQAVRAGETLCVVEAMKMENVLRAERDATVKAILVKPGDSLAVDAPILTFA